MWEVLLRVGYGKKEVVEFKRLNYRFGKLGQILRGTES